MEDKQQRIEESLAKQLSRSMELNAKLRVEVWNAAIEVAAKLIEDKFDFLGDELLAATEIRKLKK